MTESQELAAEVAEALEESGTAVTLKRETADDYDTDTSTVIPGAVVTVEAFAVLLPFRNTGNSNTTRNGEAVLAGDRMAYISSVNGTVEVGDQLLRGTERWRIVGCDPIDPAGTPVLYQAHVRK